MNNEFLLEYIDVVGWTLFTLIYLRGVYNYHVSMSDFSWKEVVLTILDPLLAIYDILRGGIFGVPSMHVEQIKTVSSVEELDDFLEEMKEEMTSLLELKEEEE